MGKICILAVAVMAIELCTFLGAHVHTHSHDDDQEPAHYKYSREANEAAAWERGHHEHGHLHEGHGSDHESGHEHGHSHGHHGHSHDDKHHADHGYDYEHLHGSNDKHAHSHGGKYAPDARDGQHSHSHGSGGCPYAHSHDHHTEHDHVHGHSHIERSHKESPKHFMNDQHLYDPNGYLWFMNDAYTRLWVYSIGSTLIISIAPFVLLSIIPVQANTAENEPLLKVLLSFGSGGLLGDAFLHLIPHAQPAGGQAHSHSHSHSHGGGHSHGPHDMSVGGYVLAGIIAFLTVEKLVRIFRSKEGGHGHSHSYSQPKKEATKLKKDDKAKKSDISSAESSCDEDNKKKLVEEKPQQTGFKVAAYLNMAADFTHNFTDGLAIGASYLAGSTIGLVTMITVLVHEVPHEIGDFAILVQSGFSKKRNILYGEPVDRVMQRRMSSINLPDMPFHLLNLKNAWRAFPLIGFTILRLSTEAMCVQLLTAVGALSGCVLSLLTADAQNLADAASTSWILPFTAGGFIYIATVSVIPELLVNSSPWQSIKEIIALLTGITLMYLIAAYE